MLYLIDARLGANGGPVEVVYRAGSRTILEPEDPELVRRYMELHRERLEERLDEQLRTLDSLEPLLAKMITWRSASARL